MVTFKEYYQGDKYAAALASPNNGKSMMRGDRKHQNLSKKEYLHKSPHINNLLNGGASQIKLQGQPLLNTLSQYDVDFKPGETKTLGNSHVQVKMFKDNQGNPCGMLTKK
jgi:hypothetical protein